MNKDEFNDLLNKYCDGTTSTEEFQKLEKAMLNDESLRQHYLSFMNLDTALRGEAEKSELEIPVVKTTVTSTLKLFVGLAAAIIILLSLNLTLLFKSNRAIAGDFSQSEPIQKGVAVVTKAINIAGANKNIETGAALEQGLLKFDRGIVQLEMFSGANLLIEGPARLNLQDVMNISCSQGKIRARVPEQAHGFSITTDDAKIIDLGTEFGVSINDSGKTDVYVYEGEVEFHPNSQKMQNLKTNDALSYSNSQISKIPVNHKIINFQNVEELHSDFNEKKLAQWKDYAQTIRERDDVVLFYGFDDYSKWSRTILNESKNAPSSTNGAIVGCKWTEGRWPGKGSLEFKNTGDRIRLNIPGEYSDMTLSCWVRIEGFDRWLSSLMLTDNYKKGDLHWQLSDKGEIILGAINNGNTFSEKVIHPEDLGRWLHIATVYNSQKREIVHFLNGKPVVRDQIEKLQTISLGNAEIGNWHCNPKTNHAVRSLNGRIDEFIIFSSPLTDQEIFKIYNQGKTQ